MNVTVLFWIIIAIIVLVCSFIWNAYIDDVNDSVESEQTQEYVEE